MVPRLIFRLGWYGDLAFIMETDVIGVEYIEPIEKTGKTSVPPYRALDMGLPSWQTSASRH